jgi:regulatory protein
VPPAAGSWLLADLGDDNPWLSAEAQPGDATAGDATAAAAPRPRRAAPGEVPPGWPSDPEHSDVSTTRIPAAGRAFGVPPAWLAAPEGGTRTGGSRAGAGSGGDRVEDRSTVADPMPDEDAGGRSRSGGRSERGSSRRGSRTDRGASSRPEDLGLPGEPREDGASEPLGGASEPLGGASEPLGGASEPLGGASEPLGGSGPLGGVSGPLDGSEPSSGAEQGGSRRRSGSGRRGGSGREGGSGRQSGPPAAPLDPREAAREICLRQLAVRPRTRLELATAMRKRGVEDEIADEILDRYDEVGIIDDAAFARAWVASRHHGRGLARRALAGELRRKGVSSDEVGEALDELDPDVEEQTARALVARRLRVESNAAPEAVFRRLVGMLARKGYPPGMAIRLVKEGLAERADAAEFADGIDPDALADAALDPDQR